MTASLSDQLASSIETSSALLKRYLAGFDSSNATRQAPSLPNHAAWILGHLALTMHRAAERMVDRELPLDWDPEPFAFGSQPVADATAYPDWQDSIARFDESVRLLASTLRSLDASQLMRQIAWGKAQLSINDLAVRMVFHNGTHAGQLTDLRRAFGMPGVL